MGNLAVGGIGDFSSWIKVKFQAIDVTAGGALVEKVVLDEDGPWPDWGTTRWDYMDIYLVQSHTYKFVLYVEVHAHAFGVGSAIADFGSIWWEDSRIEWRSIEVPNISGGGGDPCPILHVYDGENYVEEGLLDIHNPEKFDVIHRRMLITDPEPVSNKVFLCLVEHPQTHSYIDNVKLYVIDEDDDMTELRLVKAVHSEYGNILPELVSSDDVRTDTEGNETIDLAFQLNPNISAKDFIFVIEGYNPEFK